MAHGAANSAADSVTRRGDDGQMGTVHQAGTNHRRFRAVVAGLWGGPWFGQPCYHCHHRIIRGLGTVQHLISPAVRPDLAQEPSNLRPAHGSGRRRCPDCGLACQSVAASNTAPRDPDGRALPWDEKFIAAAQERTARNRATWAGRRPGNPDPPPQRRMPDQLAGRPW